MRKIKIFLFIVIFTLIILCVTKSNAAGTVSLFASKSTVTVGDEFSISVNLSGASVATLTVRVSVDTSKVEYVSGPANSSFSNGRAIYTWTDPSGGDNPKSGTIVTFKFRAKQTGKASFSVSGDFYSPDETNIKPSFSGTSVTIQEKQTTPPQTGGSTGGTTGGNTGGSTSGGASGSTGSGPSSGNTGGSSGTTNKPSGGTGNNNSNNQNQSKPSNNANLKELHLDIEGLMPAFNKNTTSYNITIPQDKDSINVNAVPEDSNAKVEVTGNTNLKTGLNKILIKVIAQDNTTIKTYEIDVTKTDNPDLANAKLENLAIENVTLNPEFSPDILQYNAEIGSDVTELNILAVPQIEGAIVNIEGKDNLQFGENVVTIKVTAKDAITVENYIVNVYRKTIEEEQNEINLISELQNNKEEIQQNKITTGDVIFCVIIAGSTGGVVYMLIRKYIKEK